MKKIQLALLMAFAFPLVVSASDTVEIKSIEIVTVDDVKVQVSAEEILKAAKVIQRNKADLQSSRPLMSSVRKQRYQAYQPGQR